MNQKVRQPVQQPIAREAVRRHYDLLSPLYRRLWGDCIHHGFWEDNESPRAAQLKLTERLATQARIPRGARVLDVGCGVGGPAFWLADHLDCSVLGITISPVQAKMARATASTFSRRVRFAVMDAEQLELPSKSVDIVWCIECSEHLDNKERFVAECARVLRPGGKLALCAWLAQGTFPDQIELVAEIERAMLCPSLASMTDYVRWMHAAGFEVGIAEDITRNVAKTWTHCSALLREREVKWMLRLGSDELRRFAAAFPRMEHAYSEGAMAYGMFVATKRRHAEAESSHSAAPAS